MILALTGKMGSGKSTVVKTLSVMPSEEIVLVKFAQPLYDMQDSIYEIIEDVYQRPSNFVKDRKLLQLLGTEWGRNTISDTLWVDIWKREVRYIIENHPQYLVVCDDLRFDNEAEVVKELGGKIIQINTDDPTRSNRVDTSQASHKSEQGIDKKYVDYTLVNNGTLEELQRSVAKMYNFYRK